MNLSLCCISLGLKEQNIGFQTMTVTRFKSLPRAEAIQILSERILNNFKVTLLTIQDCIKNKIKGYRMSSSILPVINHPDINIKLDSLPNFSAIQNEIALLKNTIIDSGIRVSAHPSEYITLTSSDSNAINNSIRDLEQHAEIFDLLNLPKNHWSPLNIHIRQEGDAETVFNKFQKNFEKLSESVKARLAIEINDNQNGTWNVCNLIKFPFEKCGLPVTFDSLHHKFCHGGLSEEQAFKLAWSSWKTIPLFHFSEGKNNTRNHADYATGIPNDYDLPVYWDCELKMKDKAILNIMSRIKS